MGDQSVDSWIHFLVVHDVSTAGGYFRRQLIAPFVHSISADGFQRSPEAAADERVPRNGIARSHRLTALIFPCQSIYVTLCCVTFAVLLALARHASDKHFRWPSRPICTSLEQTAYPRFAYRMSTKSQIWRVIDLRTACTEPD